MSLATIVKGNTFSLAIPLQVYAVEDGEVVLRDYTPESGDNITIRLKGDRRNYTYIPATNGNTAFIHLEGSEVVGVYAVEVEIVKDDDSKLTSMRFEQLEIVESIDELNEGQITEGIEQGAIYLDPEIFIAGKDGRGIVSIVKTATSGLVDTYTITYTDNTTSTFNVTNGANGINGQDGADGADGVGIASIAKTGTQGLVDTYTITMTNGTTYTYQVTNGKNGEDGQDGTDGVGIVGITKTSTSGLVDTYTILLTNGTTTTFTVTNGSDATQVQSDWSQNDSSAVDYIKNKPTIPAAQVQSDWNVSDISSKAYIKNKPTIDTALSSTSTNAVQNKAVKAALDTKVNTSDLASVTEDSEGADLVGYGTKTDGGTTTNVTVKDALDEIYESIGDGGDLATRVSALEEGKEDKFFIITVTVSYNSQTDSYTILSCDRTMAEMTEAYAADKKMLVVLKKGTATYLVHLTYADEKDGKECVNNFYFVGYSNKKDESVRCMFPGTVAEAVVEITKLQTKLTFDNVPTANSTNPVKSGGIYTALQGKQDAIADLSVIRSGAALGATAYQKPSTGIPKTDLANDVQTSLGKADTALQQHQDLSAYADGAEYDSANHLIYLKHGNTRLANPINAKDFIKDGMVDTVEIANGNLVITFNTDAGKQPITIPLTDIFNPADYYTKTQIDNAGYLTSETDPVFSASAAASITSSDITAWNNKQNALTFDTAPTASSTNPVTSGGVKTALDAKQATLVSGTSIKTVNNTSLLGSGNVAVQPTLVSGTNIKTVNSTSLLGSGDVTINGSNVNYTGSTGNVITANTSVNTALAAIDTAIGNVETLLANI